MEGPQIDPLEMKGNVLHWTQKRILKGARKLKAECFDIVLSDRRVEIGSAGEIIKEAINTEFRIDIDGIRINGMRGNNFRRDRNGGSIDMEYPTGIQNVLLVFTYDSMEGLARHNPSSTALVIKGNMGSL